MSQTITQVDQKATNDNLALLNGFNGVTAMGNQTGAITITATSGLVTLTMTGNITPALTAGLHTGDILALKVTQDATGSRTLTEGALMKLAGAAITPTATAAASSVINFVFDGTNWVETGRALNVS